MKIVVTKKVYGFSGRLLFPYFGEESIKTVTKGETIGIPTKEFSEFCCDTMKVKWSFFRVGDEGVYLPLEFSRLHGIEYCPFCGKGIEIVTNEIRVNGKSKLLESRTVLIPSETVYELDEEIKK